MVNQKQSSVGLNWLSYGNSLTSDPQCQPLSGLFKKLPTVQYILRIKLSQLTVSSDTNVPSTCTVHLAPSAGYSGVTVFSPAACASVPFSQARKSWLFARLSAACSFHTEASERPPQSVSLPSVPASDECLCLALNAWIDEVAAKSHRSLCRKRSVCGFPLRGLET